MHPVKSVKSLYSKPLKIWGQVIKKSLDPGMYLAGRICMFQSQGINGDDDNEYQKNRHHPFGYFSIPSCTPLYTINAVTPMKISAKITGEVEDVIKEVK